jgi:hypothetical protein
VGASRPRGATGRTAPPSRGQSVSSPGPHDADLPDGQSKGHQAAPNLGLVGGPGTGNTLLAIAIGSAAVKQHGKLYWRTSILITTNLSFSQKACSVWRRQDDHGLAGPAHRSLRYCGNRQKSYRFKHRSEQQSGSGKAVGPLTRRVTFR